MPLIGNFKSFFLRSVFIGGVVLAVFFPFRQEQRSNRAFSHMADVVPVPRIELVDLLLFKNQTGTIVIDIRDKEVFGKGRIPSVVSTENL